MANFQNDFIIVENVRQRHRLWPFVKLNGNNSCNFIIINNMNYNPFSISNHVIRPDPSVSRPTLSVV